MDAESRQTLLRESVERAAQLAGLRDLDDLQLPAFAEIVRDVKIRDGHVLGADLAVAEMKSLKPNKFGAPHVPAITDYATLSTLDFERAEARIRAAARGGQP